ncbi:MFS general substrate transporter [Apiospora saccharicola]|uniref:MFS general substrate transporter n=1 Tax=Apiospora saccharicola TaxID=335842 RepID=A0ABR1TMA6_9PEZI
MAELQVRELRDPEAAEACPGTNPAGTDPVAVQHAIVNQISATPYFKLLVAGFSFLCAGVNDGTLGPLIPHIIDTFRIGTGEVAIIYASTFAGWLLAAATGPLLTAHLTLGQLLAAGAALQLLAQCLRPWGGGDGELFPLYCVTFFVQSLGMAYQDSHANTFVSGLPNVPHRWLGFIHACYALGCLVGPLIATSLATSAETPSGLTGAATTTTGFGGWRRVYFILIGIGAVNMAGVVMAFKDSLWRDNRPQQPQHQQQQLRQRQKTKAAFQDLTSLFRSRALWLLSLFYFFNLGALLTAGGWVVEFLTTRTTPDSNNKAGLGYVPTGLYGGLLLGRLLLAEPTFRLGERRMLLAYTAACAALQLVFWLQPSLVASAVALSFIGFFSGPFFATGMSVASKLFPKKSKPAALAHPVLIMLPTQTTKTPYVIRTNKHDRKGGADVGDTAGRPLFAGFIFVLAQAGGAIFPSLTGLVATSSSTGVAVLQPIVLALFVASAGCWYMVPRVVVVVSPHQE